MIIRRRDTSLISHTKIRRSVRDFINHLDSSSSVAKPVGDLLIGGHANAQGFLFIPMYRNQRGPTQYETLLETVEDPAKSIAVPDTLIGHTPGDPETNHLHIKGCNIGWSPQFLSMLKTAIGSNLHITAPLHVHYIWRQSNLGVFEFMVYDFFLRRPVRFASRNEYIDALVAENFVFYDGSSVARADWEGLVPQRINKPSSRRINVPLGTTFGRRTTVPYNRSFSYAAKNFTFTCRYDPPAVVPRPEDRMAALGPALDSFKFRETDLDPGFSDTHPYPVYERFGFSSKQDFIDGHTWSFTKNGRSLISRGRYHTYRIRVPITNRTAGNEGNLIFNFYPWTSSSSHPYTVNISEMDLAFFACI